MLKASFQAPHFYQYILFLQSFDGVLDFRHLGYSLHPEFLQQTQVLLLESCEIVVELLMPGIQDENSTPNGGLAKILSKAQNACLKIF